jgi:hypothetical protein
MEHEREAQKISSNVPSKLGDYTRKYVTRYFIVRSFSPCIVRKSPLHHYQDESYGASLTDQEQERALGFFPKKASVRYILKFPKGNKMIRFSTVIERGRNGSGVVMDFHQV